MTQYEDDFVAADSGTKLAGTGRRTGVKKDTLTQSQKRIAKLEGIIKRLYEDNISGKLSVNRTPLVKQYGILDNKWGPVHYRLLAGKALYFFTVLLTGSGSFSGWGGRAFQDYFSFGC